MRVISLLNAQRPSILWPYGGPGTTPIWESVSQNRTTHFRQTCMCSILKAGPERTQYMRVTTYALPFWPPPLFFKSPENFYSLNPYIWAKMRKMYIVPYFLSNLAKSIVLTPVFTLCKISSQWVVLDIPIQNHLMRLQNFRKDDARKTAILSCLVE